MSALFTLQPNRPEKPVSVRAFVLAVVGLMAAFLVVLPIVELMEAPEEAGPLPLPETEARILPPALPPLAPLPPAPAPPGQSNFANDLVARAKASPNVAHLVNVRRTNEAGHKETVQVIFLAWNRQIAGALAIAAVREVPMDEAGAAAIVEEFFRQTAAELLAIPRLESLEILPLRAEPVGSIAKR